MEKRRDCRTRRRCVIARCCPRTCKGLDTESGVVSAWAGSQQNPQLERPEWEARMLSLWISMAGAASRSRSIGRVECVHCPNRCLLGMDPDPELYATSAPRTRSTWTSSPRPREFARSTNMYFHMSSCIMRRFVQHIHQGIINKPILPNNAAQNRNRSCIILPAPACNGAV